MKITIRQEIPSLNKLLRMHWAKRKRLMEAVMWEIEADYDRVYARPLPRCPRRQKKAVAIWSYRRRLLDQDNLTGGCKIIIDAIKNLGLIFDDSPQWIWFKAYQVIDKKNPRTEIRITQEEVFDVRDFEK